MTSSEIDTIILKIKQQQSQNPWERRIKKELHHRFKTVPNSLNNPNYPKKEKLLRKSRIQVKVVGNRTTKEFIFCSNLASDLFKYNKERFAPPIVLGITEVEWHEVLKDLQIHNPNHTNTIQSQVAVMINDKLLGGEKEFKAFAESKYSYRFSFDYKHSIQQLASNINFSTRPCAYMQISINGKDIGNLIVMLYADIVPRTCENFLRLCATTKGGYSGTPIHRIVKDGWIQCGGYGLKNNPELNCENFAVQPNSRGVFCMANADRDVDCSTQFCILLQPALWMQYKYVAFGQLIEGEKTLKIIENVPTWYESPEKEIVISKAGVFELEGNKPNNENTKNFIQGHIENLVNLREWLREVLLEVVFNAIELKQNEIEHAKLSKANMKNLHETKRFLIKNMEISHEHHAKWDSSAESSKTLTLSNFEEDTHQSSCIQLSETKSEKQVEPYYLPLTDVLYPAEVDSCFDLKRPKTPIIQNFINSHEPWKNLNKKSSYPKNDKSGIKNRIRITITGNRIKKEFIYCYYMVKGLYKYRSKEFEKPIIRGVSGLEWPLVWRDLKNQYGAKACYLQSEVAVIVNDTILGGENELKKLIKSKYVYNLCLDYYHESICQLVDYISSLGRPCAYMHFSINGKEIGCMIFMLYDELVPRTCENFLRLCELRKGGYAGTPVHRIVTDGWIQCGGYGLKNSPELGCENFIVPHDRRGVICMANNGRDVECSTQFFILLQPAPWMLFKYVAFGQLINGENTLSKIESVPTWYESPHEEIIIYKAGVFNMDCEHLPINKKAKEYIQGHIENLYEFGQLLYEELLDKVFHQIELNRVKMNQELEQHDDYDNIRETLYDYDEEGYHKYEDSYYSYIHGANISLTEKPNLPYYVPLTDVPYPSEIDSDYDLKRFLEGDYCYEDDLAAGTVIPNRDTLYIPEELIGEFFENFVFTALSPSDSTPDSYILEISEEYKAEAMDCVSFAGPIITKIANLNAKFEILRGKAVEWMTNRLISDEELRIIRMSKRLSNTTSSRKHIHISSFDSLDDELISRVVLKKRMVSYVADPDIFDSLENIFDEMRSIRKSEASVSVDHKQDMRRTDGRTSIMSSTMKRRHTQTSVMLRLLDEGTRSETLTLKDYRTNLQIHDKSFIRVAPTPSVILKYLENRSTAMNAQRLTRKSNISTAFNEYRKWELSNRRLQPSISVDQYISKNKKYNELISAASKLRHEAKSLEHGLPQGIRLPGDTPLYLSYTELPTS